MGQTVVARKLNMNSPDFEEDNMSICYGSPQECWDGFWELARVVTVFSKGRYDFSKPIQRNVAVKTYRSVG
ncbi:MAG: hypothetical protein FWB94_09065 [Chitinispirillia bacterium]|nr:hypothetical protein [Chitinispirillia bacterium]